MRRLLGPGVPVALIVVAVLAGNAIFILRLGQNNPISWTAGIAHQLCRVSCGRTMIDPNVGFITQPLGHLAALDLLHGHFPWWNYYEGLGQPLVGEMQSAALFPLTLLFAASSGLMWFHVSLETIAGISTYFLARRLCLPVLFATVGGMVFALNGTYAWLGNAVLNPVAFLPMLLLGIEIILDSGSSSTKRGWYVAAIALALSIYAGFPEVAYFDGLFCGAWALVRLFSVPRENRPRVLRRLGLGGVVGTLLALPVLIPFYDFMKVAYIGGHTSAIDGVVHLPASAIVSFFDPYAYGTLFLNPHLTIIWGQIGGYLGTSLCVLALVGIFGSRHRALRVFLASWVILGLFGSLNFLHTRALWNLIPLVQTASFQRYIMPSCEMGVTLLAVFGLVDIATTLRAKRLFTIATLLMLLVLLGCANYARSLNHGLHLSGVAHVVFIGLELIPFIALTLLLILGLFTKARVTPLLIAVVLVGESLVLFFVPTAESPKVITVNTAPLHYLQVHQGQERFLDFSVLDPNWGSQYALNEINAIDLPFPRAYKNFIEGRLYPGLKPGNQFLATGGLVGILKLEHEFVAHFKAYENASVKYLLVPNVAPLIPQIARLGVIKVFRSWRATVYELPHPRPFFSTSSRSCTVVSTNVDVATVHCAAAGATLLRTELSMKGWSATVNEQPAPITTIEGVYQSINLPAGISTVRYQFFPPHERFGLLGGLLGVLFLGGSVVLERRTFVERRRRRRAHHSSIPNSLETRSLDEPALASE